MFLLKRNDCIIKNINRVKGSICLSALFCFYALVGQAQQLVLEGWVRDSLQRPVASAFVSLVDSSLQLHAQQVTDEKGYFRMAGNYPLPAILIIEALGFQEKRLNIDKQETSLLRLGNIVLQPFEMNIEQVVIKGQRYEIKENGDSTIYKADDFLQGNERNVEDALKRLPGVEVNKDGVIYFRGKRVSKVMLEDDDLTGSNYSLLTRNLSADLLEEFHFVDHYEDNPALRGLKKSNELILNLKVKKNRFSKFIGSVSLASGAELSGESGTWYRELSSSLLYLWAKGQSPEEVKEKQRVNKLVSLNKHNNTGDDLMGRYSFDPFGGNPFHFGDVRNGYLNDFYLQLPGAMQQQRSLFNNGLKSLNTLIFRPMEQWKTTATVLYYEDRVRQAYSENYRYETGGVAFTRAYERAEQLQEWMGGLRLRQFIELSQSANVELNNVWQYDNRPFSQNNRTFIDAVLSDRLLQAQRRYYFAQDHEIKFIKRWSGQHAWVVSAYYHADSLREALNADMLTDRYSAFFSLNFPANGLQQEVNSYFERWGAHLQGVYRLSPRSYWEYALHYAGRQERLQGSTIVGGNNNEQFVPEGFGSPQRLKVQEGGVSLQHHYALTKPLLWVSNLHLSYADVTRRQADAAENPSYWLVNATTGLTYEKKEKETASTWSLTYNYSTRLPDLRTVHNMLFFQNFDRINTGADSLVVLQSHNVQLGFRLNHSFASSLQWEVYYTHNVPATSIRFRLAPLLDYTQSFWVGNISTLGQSVAWDFPLFFIYSKIQLRLDASRTSSLNEGIGVGERRFVVNTWQPVAKIESRFFGWFNYTLSVAMIQNLTSVEEATNRLSFENRYFDTRLNFSLRFWEQRLQWSIKNQLLYLPAQRQTYHFLDTELSVDWHHKRRFPIFIRAYNLTNQQLFQINNSNDVSNSTQNFALLPRYVLLGCRLSW